MLSIGNLVEGPDAGRYYGDYVGLAMSRRRDTAYTFALGFGIVYGAVFVWGLIQDPILNLIPVNGADHVLHAAIALAGIAAALASKDRRGTTTARTV